MAKKKSDKKKAGKKKSGKKKDKAAKKARDKKAAASTKKNKTGKQRAASKAGAIAAGPSIKDPEMYEALRDRGASQEKAARISNAAAASSRSELGRRGGQADDYPDRTKAELLDRARELDIAGRSTMTKDELVEALRNH